MAQRTLLMGWEFILVALSSIFLVGIYRYIQQKNAVVEPNNFFQHIHQGYDALHSSRFDKALREFEAALALKPQQAEGYLGRGSVYFVTGDDSAALADFNR